MLVLVHIYSAHVCISVTAAIMLFIGVQYSRAICNELTSLHEKWYDLGVKLQIEGKVLDGIKTSNTSTSSHLNQVVMEWLKLNSSLSYLPTWNHLIKAIALMDGEKVAKVLQDSHPVTTDTTRGMDHIVCVIIGSICMLQYMYIWW